MRSVDDIQGRIAVLVEETTFGRVKAAEVKGDAALLDDLGLDSLDYATTMLSCEEWLGVKVQEAGVDWRQVRTVRQLAELLHGAQR